MDVAFKIVSQAFNSWKVQTSFPKLVDSATLAHRLQEVKSALARQFNMPDNLIEYDRLLSREVTEEGTTVLIQFLRKSVQAGTPRFRLLPIKLEDGAIIPDMILEADIYPLDEYEQPTTLELVQSRASAEGMDLGLINWNVVVSAIEKMAEDFEPALGLEVARGVAPDFGLPCKIKYGETKLTSGPLPSAWMGCFPVRKGEQLTEISQAIPGRRTGRNLLGRELTPRVGIEAKIEAGDGAVISRGGSAIVAARDGIVHFERSGRDKRESDSRDRIPAKLVISVRPMISFTQTDQFILDLTDAVVIRGDVLPGSNIRSRSSLCIEGNVGECSNIECAGTLRIAGNVQGASVSSETHLNIIGHVKDSRLEAAGTVQIEGTAEDCFVHARDVIAHHVKGGSVEALNLTEIDVVHDSEKSAASVRINLRKLLEHQQVSNKETIEELRDSMAAITQVFGPEVALQVEAGSVQLYLLQWLRKQKSSFGASYSQTEVQEFRTLLESVPHIRSQLAALGNELREVTRKLYEENSAGARSAPPTAST